MVRFENVQLCARKGVIHTAETTARPFRRSGVDVTPNRGYRGFHTSIPRAASKVSGRQVGGWENSGACARCSASLLPCTLYMI